MPPRNPAGPTSPAQRKRVLSGMRPTGPLHIGHYFGALKKWIELQNQQDNYECFFFVADWHALTTDYAYTSALPIGDRSLGIATDWLAAGLDPGKCTIFVQSHVPEHAELHLLLSMVTPLSWLERVPTYKEQLREIRDKNLNTHAFLGYPVLQAADIVIYDSDYVPVGEDQVPHVELAREIIRRCNFYYGFDVDRESLFADHGFVANWLGMNPVQLASGPLTEQGANFVIGSLIARAQVIGMENFLEELGEKKKYIKPKKILYEPQAMLTETPRIPGTDGRKMSKSYNNFISLGESDESIRAKTKVMMTDPARKRRQDPGNPDVCPVFDWHKLFSPAETIAWSDQGCRTAGIGCIECKEAMADNLIRWIEPIRARRREFESKPNEVWEILQEGSEKARRVAGETMRRVREAIFRHEKTWAGLAAETTGMRNIRAGN